MKPALPDLRSQSGQSFPLIALLMVILIAICGIAIDVGYGLLQKRRLQASVDLALLSAARELPDAQAAAASAQEYAERNFHEVSDQSITVEVDTSCMNPGCAADDKITMRATTNTPTFFLPLFGIDDWTVGTGGAACGPCDSSPFAYDVVVVLDRSYSMCTSGWGGYNGCTDLQNAKEGVRELLEFFDPDTDRVSLAVLGSADTNSCTSTPACPTSTTYGRPFSHASAPTSYGWVTGTAASSPYCTDSADPSHPNSGSNGRFYRSAGDFMDGSPGNHDKWVLVPLSQGTDFKNSDGTINESSQLLDTLDCIKHKYWTPIAPAIYEATEELRSNGRLEDSNGDPVTQVIVYLGDGGATAQPMRRNNNGTPTTTQSWYSPTPGNNDMPCHDAVAQADRARSFGIQVFTIGYALNEGSANSCTKNSGASESGVTARQAIEQMADDPDHFYEKQTAGDVTDLFQAIGHSITSGGTRLVE